MDLQNRIVFIPDSKTPTGVAGVHLTDLAVEAFASSRKPETHQTNFKKAWERTLREAGGPGQAQLPYQ